MEVGVFPGLHSGLFSLKSRGEMETPWMTIRTKVLWALWGCDLHRKSTENYFWLFSHQFKSPRRPRARDARREEMDKQHSQLHVLCYRYTLNILHCGLLIYISWLTVQFYFVFFQFSKKMKWNYYNIWFSISSQVHLILMARRSGPIFSGPSFSTVLLLISILCYYRSYDSKERLPSRAEQ